MGRLQSITVSAVAIASLAPAVATAAANGLRGAPQMRLVSAGEAQLRFTTDRRLPRTETDAVRLRILVAGGRERVSKVVSAGRHGDDFRYTARVTSDRELRVGRKYTVRFLFTPRSPVTRLVELRPEA